MKKIKLNNGIEIPQVGLGTYLIPKDKLSYTIGKAYEMGYRMFDTAWRYHNEKDIAKALKDNGIAREDVWITSKFNVVGSYKSLFFRGGQICLKFRPIKSVFEESLRDLDTDYIDMYLLHWPYPIYKEVWKEMVKYYNKGTFKAIGVCSFLPPHLSALDSISDVKPVVNQFEISPLNTQNSLIEYCQKRNIAVEAMSTFSHYRSVEPRKEITESEIIRPIAEKHGKSIVQIVLRWMLQKDIILIPKTWEDDHLEENISIFDFELTEEEMSIIDGMDNGKFLNYNPYKATQGFQKYFKTWNGF